MADKNNRFAHLGRGSQPSNVVAFTPRGGALFTLEADPRGIEATGDSRSDALESAPDGAVHLARLRERRRCAAIFADPAASANPGLAAALAFGTDMPRDRAIRVLRVGAGKTSRIGGAEPPDLSA